MDTYTANNTRNIDMTNNTNKRITIIFNEKQAAPYFLAPGESLPKEWTNAYTIKEIINS